MFWCTVSCSYNEINHAADQTKYWIQLSLLIFRSLWSIKEEYVLCSKIAAVEERLLFYFRIIVQSCQRSWLTHKTKLENKIIWITIVTDCEKWIFACAFDRRFTDGEKQYISDTIYLLFQTQTMSDIYHLLISCRLENW